MKKGTTIIVSTILIALLILAVLFLTSGCEVLKKSHSSNSDTTSLNKESKTLLTDSDSGSVNKTITNKRDEFEWWKITQQFKPDTNITKNYYTTPQPSVIIMEGGKGKHEEQTATFDSNWLKKHDSMMMAKYDSSSTHKEEKASEKHTETKGIGLWTVIMIVGIAIVVMKLIGYGVSKFRIVRK